MTYLNPVFHYGFERFCRRCAEAGISGLIVPDLPFEEKEELAPVCRSCGIELISMIAPTSEERIRRIAAEAEGFLYVVSSMGVTGVRSEITTDIGSIVRAVRSVTDVPCAVGIWHIDARAGRENGRYIGRCDSRLGDYKDNREIRQGRRRARRRIYKDHDGRSEAVGGKNRKRAALCNS